MEARSRGSLFSQCSMIQSLTAEQIAAPIDSLTAIWPPVSGLQIARPMPNASNALRRMLGRLEPGRSPFTRQSGRQVIGAPSG